jgi:hypothetical protein
MVDSQPDFAIRQNLSSAPPGIAADNQADPDFFSPKLGSSPESTGYTVLVSESGQV